MLSFQPVSTLWQSLWLHTFLLVALCGFARAVETGAVGEQSFNISACAHGCVEQPRALCVFTAADLKTSQPKSEVLALFAFPVKACADKKIKSNQNKIK